MLLLPVVLVNAAWLPPCTPLLVFFSRLLTIGPQPALLDLLVQKARAIQKGQQKGAVMGPVIDKASLDKIHRYIGDAEAEGAALLLDGRSWQSDQGYWIGPTIVKHTSATDTIMSEEVFGRLSLSHQ